MNRSRLRNRTVLGAGVLVIGLMALLPVGPVHAANVISGPIDLGTAASYGVLAGSAITNTGLTTVTGDIGVNPGTAISGFTGPPDGTSTGAVHSHDGIVLQAQSDLTTAFNAAAGLTPTTSGLAELAGLSLTPGVYAGNALSLANNGSLSLAGNSTAVWVFQAATSLTIGSATQILISGGATACNVFWEVGSSASLGTTAAFQGTIMAEQSITATGRATVQGRLLASVGAVTLIDNAITIPPVCAPGTLTSTSGPAITSGTPTGATAGTPYSFAITATGTPAPTFAVSTGTLPAGLTLDTATGVISGIPTTSGNSTITVTAGNGTSPDVSAIYTLSVAAVPAAATSGPALAETGANDGPLAAVAGSLIAAGGLILLLARRRSPRRRLIAHRM